MCFCFVHIVVQPVGTVMVQSCLIFLVRLVVQPLGTVFSLCHIVLYVLLYSMSMKQPVCIFSYVVLPASTAISRCVIARLLYSLSVYVLVYALPVHTVTNLCLMYTLMYSLSVQ